MESNQNLQKLFEGIWQDFIQLSPAAKKIHQLFIDQGETVHNDHIAFRTFQDPRLGIAGLAQHFTKYGYKERGEYFFKEKKLYAQHFEHSDTSLPKIFISELEISKLSAKAQGLLHGLMDSLPANFTASEKHMISGRPWSISHKIYSELALESEYASWVAAYGFRTNHFTVLVNSLKNFTELQHVNDFILSHGFAMNTSGGLIKGTPEECLEQSSTMAEMIQVKFTDGEFKIPSCYYEFAKRYAMKTGELYQGFIAQSADKIFESTFKS